MRLLREANSYTQEQVADFLDIQRSAYANYENGVREMPFEKLDRICDLLGCELQVLLEENTDVVNDTLVCVFRADGLSASDLKETADFKSIVLEYMKMKRIAAAS